MPAPVARRVRLRHLGRAEPAALCRPRSLRGQAAVLRRARREALPRLRGEGALCHGRPGALEPRVRVRRRLHRAGRANPVSRRAGRPARPLPARHHRRPPAPAVLGHRLSRRCHGTGRTVRARVRAGIPRGAGGLGEDPPPRRRAGGLLPERGNRFLRGARPRGAASQRAGACLHPHLRREAVRRGTLREGDGAARRRRLHSGADHPVRPRREFSRFRGAGRAPLPQCAQRGQVHAEPRRPPERVQGRAHRRGIRRDPRGLSPLPPRHDPLSHRRPGSRRGRRS